jgi:hypothetical protein
MDSAGERWVKGGERMGYGYMGALTEANEGTGKFEYLPEGVATVATVENRSIS